LRPESMEKLLKRLMGRKHLILGNHDKWIIDNRDYLLDQGLFESIQYYREIKGGGKKLILFHYGQRVWNGSHHGSIHLYGHSHGSLPPHGLSVDIGVDCKEITTDYRPVHLNEVLVYVSKRTPATVDHHQAEEGV
jgi:calcineurin-like phosphoesterase family protein